MARKTSNNKLQPSLFTRLAIAEAELRAMKAMLAELKDMLVELKVNHDELRLDRDEWRWRAERLLADRQRGAWQRWNKRFDAVLDVLAASFCILLANARKKLAGSGRTGISRAETAANGASQPIVH